MLNSYGTTVTTSVVSQHTLRSLPLTKAPQALRGSRACSLPIVVAVIVAASGAGQRLPRQERDFGRRGEARGHVLQPALVHGVLFRERVLLPPCVSASSVSGAAGRHRGLVVSLSMPLDALVHLVQPLVESGNIALVFAVSKIGAWAREARWRR